MNDIGLFSGGMDSLVACHYQGVKEVVYCHTTLGLNEEYVKETCKLLGWKLNIVYPKRENEYELFVEKYGFPRPTSHTWIMNRLKSHPIRAWHAKEKKKREIRFISGIRRAESARRARLYKVKEDVYDGMIFYKPLLNWSNQKIRDYIKKHNLPISPTYETIGVSGDCFCGAYAKKSWGLILKQKYPELANKIKSLEKKHNKSWGQYMGIVGCDGQRTLESLICMECINND